MVGKKEGREAHMERTFGSLLQLFHRGDCTWETWKIQKTPTMGAHVWVGGTKIAAFICTRTVCHHVLIASTLVSRLFPAQEFQRTGLLPPP